MFMILFSESVPVSPHSFKGLMIQAGRFDLITSNMKYRGKINFHM